MSATPSTMMALGSQAPDFNLPNVTTGEFFTLANFEESRGLLVIFLCAHCPFVLHIAPELARIGRSFPRENIALVAITSNDATEYPQDAPEPTAAFAKAQGFSFPVLYDESQAVAKSYGAACTPDFFLYDAARKLVYRGQLDSSRPGKGTPDGRDLLEAIAQFLAGKEVTAEQRPSIGCNIKWKIGNEPEYFNRRR